MIEILEYLFHGLPRLVWNNFNIYKKFFYQSLSIAALNFRKEF
jgi:hypothetical protein